MIYSGCLGSVTAGVRAGVVDDAVVWYLVPAYYSTAVTSTVFQMLGRYWMMPSYF